MKNLGIRKTIYKAFFSVFITAILTAIYGPENIFYYFVFSVIFSVWTFSSGSNDPPKKKQDTLKDPQMLDAFALAKKYNELEKVSKETVRLNKKYKQKYGETDRLVEKHIIKKSLNL